jgi:hypothetical protein
MEIFGYLVAPIVGMITLVAVAVGYRMGNGETRIIPLPKRKRKLSNEKRRADIIARNIEAYDGTPESQQEVK